MSSIQWFDSHCHLTDEGLAGDLEGVLSRAGQVGVREIAVVGDSIGASRAAAEMAQRDGRLYAVVGVHPHNAKDWSEEAAWELRELCRMERVVALGEIGLDYHYDFSPRDAQMRAFLEQAEIARDLGMPVVIHCREAYDLLIDLAQEHDLVSIGGIVHCFSGNVAQAQALTEMGFVLGIAGPLTFKKNVELREVIRTVPLEALVLETDAPYLAPEPKRGKRNEPSYLPYTGKRMAEELGLSFEETAQITTRNARRVYRITETIKDKR